MTTPTSSQRKNLAGLFLDNSATSVLAIAAEDVDPAKCVRQMKHTQKLVNKVYQLAWSGDNWEDLPRGLGDHEQWCS